MRRRWLWLTLLLAPVIASAVDTPTNNKTFTYGLRLYLTDHYVNGDSGDVAAAYPASEDTAGKRQALTWVGGAIQAWSFTPDSSEVYTIYGRASCCSDTAISGLTSRYFQGNDIPEGLIDDARAIVDGVVTPAKLATGQKYFTDAGSDSVEVDYLAASVVENVAGGAAILLGSWESSGSGLIYFNGQQVQFADSVEMDNDLHVDGIFVADGEITLGATVGDNTTTSGDLLVGDDLTVTDQASIGDSLNVFTTQAAADSQKVGFRSQGIPSFPDAYLDIAYPLNTGSKGYAFPGAIAGRWIGWVNNRSTASGVVTFKVYCATNGWITVTCASAFSPAQDITVFGFNKW